MKLRPNERVWEGGMLYLSGGNLTAANPKQAMQAFAASRNGVVNFNLADDLAKQIRNVSNSELDRLGSVILAETQRRQAAAAQKHADALDKVNAGAGNPWAAISAKGLAQLSGKGR